MSPSSLCIVLWVKVLQSIAKCCVGMCSKSTKLFINPSLERVSFTFVLGALRLMFFDSVQPRLCETTGSRVW